MIDKSRVAFISAAVRKEAENARLDAGYDGRWDDGGARHLGELLVVWICGIEGRVPEQFKKFEQQAKKEADPEYAEWLRLQRKFG